MSLLLDGTNGITFPNSTIQASAGSVLQVVQSTSSLSISTTSTSFVSTGLIASLTPKFSTSKVLVFLNGGSTTYDANGNLQTAIYRQIASGGYSSITNIGQINLAGASYGYSHSMAYLDSPATTSTVYYQPYMKSGGGQNMYFNYVSANGVVVLTLMEIAG